MERIQIPGYGEIDPLIGLAGLTIFVALVVLLLMLRAASKSVRVEEKRADRERVARARKVVGYGWLLERIDGNNYVLHQVNVTEDGWAVDKRAGKSWLVRGVRPQYVEHRRLLTRRLIPLWIADADGKVLQLEIDGEKLKAAAKSIPPELSYAVINSKLLSKVARVISQDYSLLMYGMFLGLGLAVLLVLVVLPAMGIPVQIGAKPINVNVTLPSRPLYSLPPPGNYTPAAAATPSPG